MLHNTKKNMMRARCLAYAVRALFPEIILGLYTDAEIVDAIHDSGYETSVNEEGDVIVLKSIDNTEEYIESKEIKN